MRRFPPPPAASPRQDVRQRLRARTHLPRHPRCVEQLRCNRKARRHIRSWLGGWVRDGVRVWRLNPPRPDVPSGVEVVAVYRPKPGAISARVRMRLQWQAPPQFKGRVAGFRILEAGTYKGEAPAKDAKCVAWRESVRHTGTSRCSAVLEVDAFFETVRFAVQVGERRGWMHRWIYWRGVVCVQGRRYEPQEPLQPNIQTNATGRTG